MAKKTNDIFDSLAKRGIIVPPEYKVAIAKRVNELVNYEPTVGVLGKTGAGKSSLCNALFGQNCCPVDDIESCTRKTQAVTIPLSQNGLKLLDVPGVGESGERDNEYAELYKNLLPDLDLILWVLKGDERAYTQDELFYVNLLKPYMEAGMPLLFIINQVDKIEPSREWDYKHHNPGIKQQKNIDRKCEIVAGKFEIPINDVCPISANEGFGLVTLVDKIIHALPNEKKVAVLRTIKDENCSSDAKVNAKEGLAHVIIDLAIDFVPIPGKFKEPVKIIAKEILNELSETIEEITDTISDWWDDSSFNPSNWF